jgi:hypothetical protein
MCLDGVGCMAGLNGYIVIPAVAGIHNLRSFENMDPRGRGDDVDLPMDNSVPARLSA